ncbi:MAG: methyltransferase family protein [Shinella sp.]|uniref:methyltransferase family protein n=1 Tax=Shinella sp. TaxID=1870904 RepID=UPI004035D961
MNFALLAAFAWAWSYVVAFLVLTAITSHRNGKSVWLFGKGNERQALPALLFRAAFALAVTYPPISIWLLARPETFVGTDPHSGLRHAVDMFALALMAIGATFALYSQNHMGSSWRIGAATGHLGNIVDTGPFRISRNPVFVGQCVLFIGLLIVFPTAPQLLITIGLFVAVRLQVGIEERVLAGEMGEDYQAYKKQVRRWL